jgi:hypothetical protein
VLKQTFDELSRARAIRRFRWSILAPLIALFALVLLPVLYEWVETKRRATEGIG